MDVLALDARDSSCAFALAQAEQNEACLSGFVVPAGEQNGGTRYIVRALRPVPDAAYIERTPHYAQLHPDFCLDMANQSRHSGEALVLCHTHPGDSKLAYSTIDDRAEIELRKYFDRRASKGAHFSLLFSSNGVIGRELGRTAGAKIQIVGDTLRTHSATTMNGVLASGRFSRQVLAFGAAAQKALMTLRV